MTNYKTEGRKRAPCIQKMNTIFYGVLNKRRVGNE